MKNLKLLIFCILIFTACTQTLPSQEINSDNNSKQENNSSELNQLSTSEENKKLVEDYINQNISTLSPVNPVLGGNWYVTEIQFHEETSTVTVNYEDGHITAAFTANYEIDNNNNISITNINELPL